MDLQLKGKRAFISGSTQGIGFAIAKKLLEEGASVIINGRQHENTERAKKKLQKQFPSSIIDAKSADFSKFEEVESLLQDLSDIDILVNNVGVFEIEEFENIADEDWYNYFEVNVMSGVRLSRKLFPEMLNKNWGRVIFISSESGVNVPENMIHYGMTKAAVSAIANGMSKLTKGTEITVNMIVGGPSYSDGVAEVVETIAKAQNLEVEQMKSAIIQQSN